MTTYPEPGNCVRIIALDYYDGPTEGFAKSLIDDADCYFTLIAWDSTQDDRLFAVVKTDQPLYERVIDLLQQTQPLPDTTTWIPKWELSSEESKNEIAELISLCRARIIDDGFLLLTQQIGHSSSKRVSISSDLAYKLDKALAQGTPDDIQEWLG